MSSRPALGDRERLDRLRLATRHRLREARITSRGWIPGRRGRGSLPGLLVIGTQRGGTTSLASYLARHPQVVPPRDKELQYFSRRFSLGERWYRGSLPATGDGTLTFDASPLYLFDPHVPARVAATLPEARVVALLREPAERALSHHAMNTKHGFETRSISQCVEDELAELALGVPAQERLERDPVALRRFSYLERGLYADQLERWFQHVPREQVLVLRSEDLFERPCDTVDRVLEFVGLSPLGDQEYEVLNAWGRKPVEPGLRERLDGFFEEPNERLSRLLSWDAPIWP